ncbi:tegument protein UL37 [Falconid herpesvirus 1]|uniref:Tegument protein UL37 n=1 Tax=Falconid herpesvirus 1 TaxID=1510155 RepID=A0A068EP88_9ALPH|nr:tegument protein UL37 [Falconid herpesvirus 1]AID52741.1 tegument protein UL37 [Falconid herpesvirus 1]
MASAWESSPGSWPLKELLKTISAVSARSDPSKKWTRASAEEVRTAIGVFCLAQGTMTIHQAEVSWRDAFSAIIEAAARTSLPEAIMLAQNFPGFVLWRITTTWDKSSWKAEAERLGKLVDDLTGTQPIAWLTRNNLKIAAKYGPATIRQLVTEWLALFADSAAKATAFAPERLLKETDRFPNLTELTTALVNKRFEHIFDFPFVQEGLRLISRSVGWVMPFIITARCTTNLAYTPLTRALFTIALVDRYFWGPKSPQPQILVDRFANDCDELTSDEIMTPAEANATKRTAYEVRVSAAIAYADPYVRDVRPGQAAARVRSDPDVLASATSLTKDALMIHMSAVLKLTAEDGPEDRGRASSVAMANVIESARAAWDAVQASTSPRQVLEALIESGFVQQTCKSYETTLKALFARRYTGEENKSGIFDEAQQAIGSIAFIGNIVFGLIESYGPGLDYADNFIDALISQELDTPEYLDALGIPMGGVDHIISRCMGPRSYVEHVRKTRAVLLAEIDDSEASRGGRTIPNGARESLMLWFDHRAKDLWGITPPEDSSLSESLDVPQVDEIGQDAPSSAARPSPQRSPDSSALLQRDAIMIKAAAEIRYPDPMPTIPDLADPAFTRYVLATAVVDAITATAAAVFSLPHLTLAIKVLTWARDYGTPYVQSFGGHKTKITALISALLPFAEERPQRPVPEDAANVESLLGELYGVVEVAVSGLPSHAAVRLPPKPDVSNSTLLVSMYATALRLSYDDLSYHTGKLADEIAAKAWLLADAASTAQAFFACRFSSDANSRVVQLAGRESKKNVLGKWRIKDVMAAVGDAYGACTDVMAELRVSSLALRGLVEDTGRRIPMCDMLAKRSTAAEGGAARIFSTLSADYAGLSRVQTALDIHIRKLVACQEPPGMSSVAWLLRVWAGIAALNGAVRAPEDLVRIIENLGAAWKEVDGERAVAVVPKSLPPDSDIQAAVADFMGEYGTVDGGTPEPRVVVSARHNLTTREEINFSTLELQTTVPEDVNPASFAGDFVSKQRVAADVLTGVVDSIFNSGRGETGARETVVSG